MDLDPRRLLLLQAISESGSLGQAARRLGRTRSAVSQQLAKLEQEVQAPLVDRVPGRLELTEAGRILARAGARIGESLADAERELTSLTGSVSGPIIIAIPPAGRTMAAVAHVVPALAERHPELRPTIVEVEETEGLRMLRAGSLDVMVLKDDRDTAVPLPPGYIARILTQDQYRIIIPSSWDIPNTVEELTGKPWIGAPPTSACGRCFRRLADLHAIAPSTVHLAISPGTLEAMAAAGLGAAIAPWFYADWLQNCTVLDLPVSGQYIVRAIHRPTPAAEAVGIALADIALLHAERLVAGGIHKRETSSGAWWIRGCHTKRISSPHNAPSGRTTAPLSIAPIENDGRRPARELPDAAYSQQLRAGANRAVSSISISPPGRPAPGFFSRLSTSRHKLAPVSSATRSLTGYRSTCGTGLGGHGRRQEVLGGKCTIVPAA
ncbi:molybdate transport repressor ModE-like protein [Catenulispora sp. GP43]|uniref:LysR family transcriptional regulator n=1 Tax=Catenulispora sp. GP43 TaxID=3156263 RepID=UPI003512897F